MKTTSVYQSSLIGRLIDVLFVSKKQLKLKDTFFGSIFLRLYVPHLSQSVLYIVIFLVFFERVVASYIPMVESYYVVPTLVLIALLFSKKENIYIKRLHIYYLGLLSFGAISAFLASLGGIDPSLLLAGWSIYSLFFVVMLVAQSIKNKKSVLEFLVFSSMPLALVGIYQFLAKIETSSAWVAVSESIGTRAFSLFGSPNVFGALMSLVFITSVSLFLSQQKKIYLVTSAVSLFSVYITFSRSAWAGLFLGLVFFAVTYKKKLIAFTPLVVLTGAIIPQIRERVFIIFTPDYLNSATLDGRLWSYLNGIHIFKSNFLFGTGPGTYGGLLALENASPIYLQSMQLGYTSLYFTDNQWLEILVQLGVPGALMFVGFFVSSLVYMFLKFRFKNDILALGAAVSLICFGIMGMFSNIIEFGVVAIPMAAIIGSVIDEE